MEDQTGSAPTPSLTADLSAPAVENLASQFDTLRSQLAKLQPIEFSLNELLKSRVAVAGGLSLILARQKKLGTARLASGLLGLKESFNLNDQLKIVRLREQEALERDAISSREPFLSGLDKADLPIDPFVLDIMQRFGERWPVIVQGIVEQNAGLADDFEAALARIAKSLDLVPEGARETLSKYADIAAAIKAHNADIHGDFEQLRDGLVGHSVIPDMVRGIGEWIGKLDGEMVKPAAEMTEALRASFDRMGRGVAESIGNMVKAGKFDLDSLRQTAARVVNDLRNMIVDRAVTKPLQGLFGRILDGVFGGPSAGGVSPVSFGATKLKAMAHGGPVWPGKAFLVGEKGPELFLPPGLGEIVPNERLRANGVTQNGAVQVVNNITIDARGADAAQLRRVEQAVHMLVKATPSMAVAAVMRHMARNPGY